MKLLLKHYIHLVFVLLAVASSIDLCAQKHEIGIGLGTSNFLGDLGGANGIGKPFIIDVEVKAFKPAATLFYQYNFARFFSINTNISYCQVIGDDRWVSQTRPSKSWARHYRNLSFKSDIFEFTLLAHFDILRYKFDIHHDRYLTPFIGAGAGIFYMNPKAYYDGVWVPLQPLGTEGQGLPGHRAKYSLFQPTIPVSFGLKFQVNTNLKLTLECMHHFTFTDYIDDVSTVYLDPNELFASGVYNTALTYALSRRSGELQYDARFDKMTKPGAQRGDPKDKDSYFTIFLKVSYLFGKKRKEYGCYYKPYKL